jgi:predicted nucleotidyltransferase
MIRENKLPSDILDRLPSLKGKLRDVDVIDAVYLFGSLTEKNLKPLSDIDIAILLQKQLGADQISVLRSSLAGLIADTLVTEEFDLVILNDAPVRFSYNILKNGILLFARDEKHLIDFREKVVKYYLDFSFYLKEFDKTFLKGLGYHG